MPRRWTPRYELGRKVEERSTFTGRFVSYGTKPGYGRRPVTILLADIADEHGKVVTDHLWFNRTQGFDSLGPLRTGDRVKFDARVKTYHKGGRADRIDYKLSYPSQVRRV